MEDDRIEKIAGGFWIARDDTHISAWQRECGKLDHDAFLIPFCCQFIPVGGFVLDGGAFNGDHATAYSRKVGRDGIVIAVEPGTLAFTMLEHNVKLFDHRNVIIANLALSNCDHHVAHAPNADGNLGMSHIIDGDTLKTITIDQIVHVGFPFTPKLSFMKLDLEGWELKALRGARQTLEQDRPVIVLEINEEALRLRGDSYEEIRVLLKAHNYTFSIIQPECQEAHCAQFDLLCLPND